jgi:magnesium transporter
MKITCYRANETLILSPDELRRTLQRNDCQLWIDIHEPDEAGLTLVEEVFNLHPLAMEDVRNQEQRPKAEQFADHLFIILNPMTEAGERIEFHEMDIFLSRNALVTVHRAGEGTVARAEARIAPERMSRPVTTTYLFYTLLDTILDDYVSALEKIENEIDALGARLLEQPRPAMLNELFGLKTTLNEMYWVLWPHRHILNLLNNHDLNFIDARGRYYLRDISDHVNRLTDIIQGLRDNVTGLINLYMSAVSNQLNRAVNRLTFITIAFGAFGVITGFYGMNFEQTWPPFTTEWGVPFVVVMMLVIALVVFILARRINRANDSHNRGRS